MELSHDQQLEVVNTLINEFWPDMQLVHTDIAHDIMNKVHLLSEETQLTILIEVISCLLALEVARFTCILDSNCQESLWEDLTRIALEKGEKMHVAFKKGFKQLVEKAQRANEDSN